MNKILQRIEREADLPGLASILAERFSPTDLQSLLIEVARLRSNRRKPSDMLADFASNRFVRPSPVSPRSFLIWEQIAFAHLPLGFQALELSPVCPLGTNSVVAPVDQNWAVSTVRNTEVVSDSTNVLALECALRRRELLRENSRSSEPVHLAASHRLLRAQQFKGARQLAHFAAFVLCSAGRDQGSLSYELNALKLHIGFYIAALRAYLGSDTPLYLSLTDLSGGKNTEKIETQFFPTVRPEFAGVTCEFDEERRSGRGYYRDVCFHIHAGLASGERLELVDGGAVDWTQKLLSSAKERLVISGIGSERLCAEFRGKNES